MIYTSYYAKYKGESGISISGKCPEWYKGREFKILAPKYSFFSKYKSGEISEKEYTEQYYKQVLDKLDPIKVYDHLIWIAEFHLNSNIPVLLCYEKPDKFCHRHIVTEWFRSAGLEAEELAYK